MLGELFDDVDQDGAAVDEVEGRRVWWGSGRRSIQVGRGDVVDEGLTLPDRFGERNSQDLWIDVSGGVSVTS